MVSFKQTRARGLVLSMKQQTGATQLCLNVQSATLLPGCHKIQDVRVRTQALVVPGFPHSPVPLTVPPEAMSRALDCIQAAVLAALNLQKQRKYQGLLLGNDNLGHNEKIWLTEISKVIL